MDKRYQSRKFIVAVLLVVGANAQAAFGNIDSGTYAVVCGIAGAFYQWANVQSRKGVEDAS